MKGILKWFSKSVSWMNILWYWSIPLLQIEGCASSTCKYTYINTHHWMWWMAKGRKQSKYALFDNWLHKAQVVVFACNAILSFRRTKKINMYWEGSTFHFISTGEVLFFFVFLIAFNLIDFFLRSLWNCTWFYSLRWWEWELGGDKISAFFSFVT